MSEGEHQHGQEAVEDVLRLPGERSLASQEELGTRGYTAMAARTDHVVVMYGISRKTSCMTSFLRLEEALGMSRRRNIVRVRKAFLVIVATHL